MKRSRLGQNFLFDKSIISRIIDAAAVTNEDVVAEIGPGPGTLTKPLSEHVKKLVAIEFDQGLYERLRTSLAGYLNIQLIHGDALKFHFEELGDFKVVSNIPYYITTPIIFRLLEARKTLKTMTLTMQREVAERIVAGPGGKDYGVLSIMVQYYARPELKFIIPAEFFRPAPKVDSAVLHIAVLEKPAILVKNEQLLFRVVKTAFSQRRKTLSNSLKSLGPGIREILIGAGIDPGMRPETLGLPEFGRISDILAEKGGSPSKNNRSLDF